MELKQFTVDYASFMMSRHELGTIGNALNEVCNGIHVVDFESKMGGDPKETERILDDIIPVYRKVKRTKSASAAVRFSRRELRAIIGALKEVLLEIDAIEFATRMGAEIREAKRILDQIVPIYRKMKHLGLPKPQES